MGRPKIHLTAPRNWINDPNGFIYYKGEYHLFYQYFPYDCRWGTMHWGHATSGDLIKWKHHPIALYPTKEYDQNRCFSGTALIKDDKLHLYYTYWRKRQCNKCSSLCNKIKNCIEGRQKGKY